MPTRCPNGHPVAAGETTCSLCGTATPTEALPLPAPEPVVLPTVPGYEVLGVLGRGGMGVVYKARQLSLNRIVALKMIRDGVLAGPEERARFRAEAEAAARLHHPNIAHVHELGEHGGRPFFSLELCEGGSLEKRLAGKSLPPWQAAELVQTLAGAVQAAHEAGVVHRDLKPANVLLGAPASGAEALEGARTRFSLGTPKVTDFGLAKKLDEPGQTQTGVIMGTPSYMAPEQARGEKAIGPTADVHALGAILYQCLTGRPPFRAATVMDTLLQVRSEEPTPPRRLRPALPIDLEAICLKCLEKKPARRYASALALAEDLGRFLAGRPTAARPVGRGERVLRWVKRRPVVAALSAALLLLALGGGAALVAWRLEVAASQKKDIQEGIQRAAQQATEAEDRRLDELLRALGPDSGPLTPTEVKALRDVAGEDERIRLRFLERGLQRPESAARLGRRSEQVVQAVVGLDAGRRQEAGKIVLGRLAEEQADPKVGSACVLVGLALGLAAREDFCREGVKAAEAEMSRTGDAHELARLGEAVGVLARRLGLDEGERAASGAAGRLIDAALQKDPKSLEASVPALRALSGRVTPEAATALVDRLLGEMGATADPKALAGLAKAVAALAGRLEREQGERAAGAAAERLYQVALPLVVGGPRPLVEISRGLAALPGPKAAEYSQQIAGIVVSLMTRTFAPESLIELSGAVLELSDRLPADARAGLLNGVVNQLLTVLIQGGSAGPAGGPPAQAPPAGNVPVPGFGAPRPPDAATLYRLVRTLDRLAERVPAGAGVQAVSAGVGGLMMAAGQPTSPAVAHALGEAVVRLAGQLPPERAEVLAGQLHTIVQRASDPQIPVGSDPHVLAGLVRGMTALAERVPADRRPRLEARLAGRLLEALERTAEPYALAGLGQAVAVLQGQGMGTAADERLAGVVDRLLAGLARTADPGARAALGRAVAAVAGRLGREKGERAAAAAADRLTEAMVGTDDPEALRDLLGAEVILLGRLGPGQGGRGAAGLRRALEVPAALGPEAEAVAAGLSTAGVVTLLGEPTCVGPGRRFLLRELARRIGPPVSAREGAGAAIATLQADPLLGGAAACSGAALYPDGRRPFADIWEAADYLHAHYPELDGPSSTTGTAP